MTVIGIDPRTAGVWLTRREIVVALVESDSRATMHARFPRSDAGRQAFLDTRPPNVEVVFQIDQLGLHRMDPLFRHLQTLGTPCWLVDSRLVEDLRCLSAVSSLAPEHSARLLARLRLARHPAVRGELRCWPRPPTASP